MIKTEYLTENPDWQEFQEHVRLYRYYTELPNNQIFQAEKRLGLKSLGKSDEEVERLCKPKGIDMEEVMRDIKETSKRELSMLARLDREKRARTPTLEKTEAELKLAEARFVDE
jgi:hypothetical protein